MRGLIYSVIAGLLLAGRGIGEEVLTKPENSDDTLPWVRCLDLALQHNPEILRRKAQLEQVEGVILTQRANFLPTISAGGYSTSPTIEVGIFGPIYTAARAPAFAAFPFARGAARANLQLAIMEAAYQLRVAYLMAYYNQQLVPVARKELSLLQNRLDRAPSLFTAGRLSKADLQSLQVREAIAKSKVETSQNVAETSRLTMLQIVGLDPGDPRLQGKLITDFKTYATQETDPGKLVQLAFSERQDLQLLTNLQKVNESLVLVAAANYYPTLGAGVSFTNKFQPPNIVGSLYHTLDPKGYDQNLDTQNFRSASTDFVMVANWRIFDGGATAGSVVSAQANVVKSQILIQQIKDQIPRQVELAVDVVSSTQKVIDRLKNDATAEKNMVNLQQVYEAGQISQVELLDAQDEYTLYQENLLRLESGHDQALAALDRLVGQTFRVEITLP